MLENRFTVVFLERSVYLLIFLWKEKIHANTWPKYCSCMLHLSMIWKILYNSMRCELIVENIFSQLTTKQENISQNYQNTVYVCMLVYIFVRICELIIRRISLLFTLCSRDFWQKEDNGDLSTIYIKHTRMSFSMKCIHIYIYIYIYILPKHMCLYLFSAYFLG